MVFYKGIENVWDQVLCITNPKQNVFFRVMNQQWELVNVKSKLLLGAQHCNCHHHQPFSGNHPSAHLAVTIGLFPIGKKLVCKPDHLTVNANVKNA
jgi:hypothetical protein